MGAAGAGRGDDDAPRLLSTRRVLMHLERLQEAERKGAVASAPHQGTAAKHE